MGIKTIKEFVAEASGAHACKYDYAKFIYVTNITKGLITCPTHGEFWQTPSSHLQGHGCMKCGVLSKSKCQKDFNKAANKTHGGKYDYSKFVYANNYTDGIIICFQHGEFKQSPTNHIKGNGCPKCSTLLKTKSIVNFMLEAHKIHNGNYDYSKFSYINAHTKGIILCPHHGKFKQRPTDHLSGKGCPYCSGNKVCLSNCFAITHSELIKQWNYEENNKIGLTPYNVSGGSVKNVAWQCPIEKDHKWKSTPHNRTKGRNCPYCSGNKVCLSNCLLTKFPEIAKQWHPAKNGKLTPLDVTAGSNIKVWWKDEFGHEWKTTVWNRTNSKDCPICSESKGEKQIASILEKLNIKFERQFKFDDCKDRKKLSFDFCVWKNNIPYLIEYQGLQHYIPQSFGSKKENAKHTMFKGVQKRDAIKRKTCKGKNYPLLEIPYWEYDNMEKLIRTFLKQNCER